MSSIIKKRRGDRVYLYAATSARVDGKPRIVDQVYLGTEDEVIARLSGQGGDGLTLPNATEHRTFGDVAAVWGMLTRLDAAGTIDAVVGAAPVSDGVTVGTYLALAALNRICDPRSKAAFAEWYRTTALPQITGIRAKALDHRQFWEAMDRVEITKVDEIEAALTRRMIEIFGLDTSGLILDMTNFATFIDSTNPHAPVAARGKAKQKRYDLRLVGLGLVATRDGGIPLLSRVYKGSLPDVTQFTPMIEELARRYADAVQTLTFDAGQNSEVNFRGLAALGLHFVGSVPPSDLPDLLARPTSDRALVDRYAPEGLTALDTRATVLGADRRVILTHSPTLHTAQRVGFAQTLAKATGQLDELAARLARGRTRKPRAAVEAEITSYLAPRWVARVLRTELTGDIPKNLRLTWHHDEAAQAALEEEIFGKRILVTDHDDWPIDQVVDAYRSQEDL
ncbi:IS1634 family transposase, partial [Frankia sp. Cj3]|uniref:IS1634 family transposase n=1 Tax=Frankia sp. Cj3 TaxID=2880976 RepID=UPI001EF6EFF8